MTYGNEGLAEPPARDAAEVVVALSEQLAAARRKTFRHWRIYKAGGNWWALRGGETQLFPAGPHSLIRSLLMAVTVVGLGEQLEIQEHLRAMTPDELDAVWREHIAAAAR